jgi:predicted  nucleic acid-binding Zn-ribbon protein
LSTTCLFLFSFLPNCLLARSLSQVSKLTSDLAATSKQRELAEAAALLLQQTLKGALEKQQTHEVELQTARSGAQQLQDEVARLQTQLEAARQHSAQQAQQLQQQLSRSQPQQPAYSQQPPAHGYHSGSYPPPPPLQQQLPYQAQAPLPTGAVPYLPPSGSVPYQQPRDQHGRPNVPYLPQQQQPHAASYPAPQPQGYPQPYSQQQQQQQPYLPQHHYDHPAVAELTQLQSKYETLKNDYNSLVDTYNAQKESLRTGAESLASAQRDVQTERTKVTQLSADLKRASSQLTECEGALARAQKERDRLREECGRAKDDAARLHRNLKGMGDALERMRERAATDAKRNTQMQRTMGEQFDALLEEKSQLAAQLGILLSDSANGAGSGNACATSAPPPAHLPPHATSRQTHAAQELALNQKDTFSDELPPLDVLPPASGSKSPSHPPSPQPLKQESLNQSDAGAGLSLAVKHELAPASDALPATAEDEEPEEGEI